MLFGKITPGWLKQNFTAGTPSTLDKPAHPMLPGQSLPGDRSSVPAIRRCGWLSVLLLLLTVGCSEAPGGGGIGGTGKAIAPDTLVVGNVEGFGSVIVNNQRFETDSATVSVDGSDAQLTDLSVGMRVVARVNAESGQAFQLRYQPDAAGTVSSVAADGSSLEVLGQTIFINDNTLLDEIVLSDIVPGSAIEVSGYRNAEYEIVASYIKHASAATSAFTVGRVEDSLDGHGAMIGGAIIDAAALALEMGLTEAQYEDIFLEHGALVRVEAMVSDTVVDQKQGVPAIVLTATSVSSLAEFPYNAGDTVQILGAIGSSISDEAFRVADIAINTDSNTVAVTRFGTPMEFPESPQNRQVLLQGTALTTSGTVLVSRIQFLDEL